MVSYTRSVLYNLERIEDPVLGRGEIIFGDPSEEEGLVRKPTRLIEEVKREIKADAVRAKAGPNR